MNENLYGARESRSYVELQKGGGFFSKFDWMADPYALFLESKSGHRKTHEAAIEAVHERNVFRSHPLKNKTF